jgi:hypothetical protein
LWGPSKWHFINKYAIQIQFKVEFQSSLNNNMCE